MTDERKFFEGDILHKFLWVDGKYFEKKYTIIKPNPYSVFAYYAWEDGAQPRRKSNINVEHVDQEAYRHGGTVQYDSTKYDPDYAKWKIYQVLKNRVDILTDRLTKAECDLEDWFENELSEKYVALEISERIGG